MDGWLVQGEARRSRQGLLFVITEFEHGAGKKSTREPVKQYLPIDKVKRITMMKTQILVHI